MSASAPRTDIPLEIARILRVDHAGERGAISIYSAQIAVSRWFWPQCVSALTEMRSHERRHFSIFDAELKGRGLRSCYALALWSLGGWLLGILTALMGPRAIWACTAAIEHTVDQHLDAQVAFLQQHDAVALSAVQGIRADEQLHLAHALDNGGMRTGWNRPIWWVVTRSTALAIWLSHRL